MKKKFYLIIKIYVLIVFVLTTVTFSGSTIAVASSSLLRCRISAEVLRVQKIDEKLPNRGAIPSISVRLKIYEISCSEPCSNLKNTELNAIMSPKSEIALLPGDEISANLMFSSDELNRGYFLSHVQKVNNAVSGADSQLINISD